MSNTISRKAREWQSPVLFNLSGFECTEGGPLTANIEQHCTVGFSSPANSYETRFYAPTTSGYQIIDCPF